MRIVSVSPGEPMTASPGEAAPAPGSDTPFDRAAHGTATPFVHTMTLPLDSYSPVPVVARRPPKAVALPWKVTKVDSATGRVYLVITNAGVSCAGMPWETTVRVDPTTVTIAAFGQHENSPCTLEADALLGYVVVPGGIGNRTVRAA